MTDKASQTIGEEAGAGFSFAFQPVVDTVSRLAYSHEALVRGLNGESAYQVLGRYKEAELAVFDVACQVRAIEVATRIGLHTNLNLNLLPSAAMNPALGIGLDRGRCSAGGVSARPHHRGSHRGRGHR